MADPSKMTNVLVIDDDQDDFLILEGMLKTIGSYDATWAANGEDGLDRMDERTFDVVLVDHRLGAEDGLEVISTARERGAPPLILATGMASESVDRDAAKAGAADYLVKSDLTPESLDRSIRYAISQRGIIDALRASEVRFRSIFEDSPIGMALHTINGEYLATNSVYDEMFGYTGDMTIGDLIAIVEPESRETVLAAFDGIRSGNERQSFEGAFKSGTGERIVAMVRLTVLPQEGSDVDQVIAQVIDVTELKDTQAKLEDQLENKNHFLAAVSHELRTPLTAVIGLAELLREDDAALSAEHRSDLIDTIVESGFDVSNMVEDLLTAARQEAGQLVVVSVPVNLDAQTKQAIEVISGAKEIEVSGDAPTAIADPGRVRQVLRNLLTNAVKYGGSDIRVELDSVGEFARAVVSDDGPGVAKESEEQIFRSYQRAHSKETHPSSVGIGLNISQELAREMGGDLIYRREGGRTRFEFTLPVEGQ